MEESDSSIRPEMPEEIRGEMQIVCDLLEVSFVKPSLIRVALLHAIMTLEKSLRFLLKEEYKNISKIKFSVLIDKAQQKFFFDKEAADQFRSLKDLRNLNTHHAIAFVEEDVETKIAFVLQTVQHLFSLSSENQEN